jgi:dienelactone hydrolase
MRLRARAGLLFLSAIGVLGVQPALRHAQAAGVLSRLDPNAPAGLLGRFDTYEVRESELSFAAPQGSVKARLYEPQGAGRAPGLVMVHGVHRLGMNEPRLMRFARSMASTGIVILTPDVRELADYAVAAESVATLGSAADSLAEHLPWVRTVGLMGLSFAGGLALLAASDPAYAPRIGYVIAVGAHDDLPRVSRFFATGRIEEADGTTLEMRPHEYGPLVLVYAHAEGFFPAADVPAAREALRLWLWEERAEARRREEGVSAAAKATLDALFDGHVDAVAPELLRDVEARARAMSAVSPHGHLGGVHVPVFLLHGAKDSVIPASETPWIARDLPEGTPRRVLVSPLVGHVELEGQLALGDVWDAVHFLAGALAEARAAP